jgi:NAD-dependent dihydropyrimidine dehydrogenase PreA subunit
MTGYPGTFAGGDMVSSERTVTVAIGHGKKAAGSIDAWLSEGTYAPAARHELASFGGLNTWYYADAPHAMRPKLEAARRIGTFTKLGDGQYEIDYDYCKGCGLCATECPSGAIQMTPEPT